MDNFENMYINEDAAYRFIIETVKRRVNLAEEILNSQKSSLYLTVLLDAFSNGKIEKMSLDDQIKFFTELNNLGKTCETLVSKYNFSG